MNLPRRHRSRTRGRARLALAGDFPDTGESVTEVLDRVRPPAYDGRTHETEPPAPRRPPGERFADPRTWSGASDIGLMAIATFTQAGPAPLAGYQPAPASFPALPPAIEDASGPRDVLAPVPVTEPAVIGDQLRLPVIWCEMPGCIGWFHHPDSAGFADSSSRAMDAGWREDALGRLACPECQQSRPDYRNPQPVTWHHPEVARRWHARQPLSDTGAFRLGVEAEVGRRISREDPGLARAIAGATHRTAGAS